MLKQMVYLMLMVGLVAINGCATGRLSTTDSKHESLPPIDDHPDEMKPPPAHAELNRCRTLTKVLNMPLISSVRAALMKVGGIPVQALEVIEAGQPVYHVHIIDQHRHPKTVTIDQRMADAEKLLGPSSLHECTALLNAKEEKIITAMRLAHQKVPGKLVKAAFEKYEDRFLYTVTVEDRIGTSHLVRIDADAQQVVKVDPPFELHIESHKKKGEKK